VAAHFDRGDLDRWLKSLIRDADEARAKRDS
jgi:hypothetical protein